MEFQIIIRIEEHPARADKSAVCAIMQFQKIIWIKECPLRADNAHEHIDPGIRMGDSAVMLSTFATLSVNSAKHLDAHRARPFAAAQGDSAWADYETSQYAAMASLIIHISF